MDRLLQDLKFALRRLTLSPGFTAIVGLTLAVGIGANTAIFSMVDAMLLRPLPYPEPEELVSLNHRYPSLDLTASVSVPGFHAYRTRTRSFESIGAMTGLSANLTGTGDPVRVSGARATSGYLQVFDVPPALGRTFTPEEDEPGSEQVAVLSHGFWQRHLGGREDVLGSSIRLNDVPYTVIGVMPPGYRDYFNRNVEFWVPAAFTSEQLNDPNLTREFLAVGARVRDGVTVEAASSEMADFAERLKEEYPGLPSDWSIRVQSLDEVAKRGMRTPLLILLGAVGFVLLITCANVAGLLLARSAGRRKEIAIRGALGADRGQIVRQLLSESLVMAVVGGALGIGVAAAGLGLLVETFPSQVVEVEVGLDGPVLLFAVGVSLLAGLVFGLAPALRTARTDLQKTLREGGPGASSDRSGHRVRRFLVAGEFALALTLLTGAGLMIRSLIGLQSVDPGFEPDGVLTAAISLPSATYPENADRRAFMDRLIDEVEALPGVEAAGTTSVLPFSGSWATTSFNVEGYTPGDDEPIPWGDIRVVYPGFEEALGLRLLKGRFLTENDGPDQPVVGVVDDELVRRYWPDTDPIGRHVYFGEPGAEGTMEIRVVGVVEHTAHEGLDADPRIQLYGSYRQNPQNFANLVIRTDGDPLTMVAAVRGAVRSVDPDMPIAAVRTMSDLVGESMTDRRVLMNLLSIFAAVALLLASLGIYGVMSQLVGERRRELGVRMAFGATAGDVISLVLRQGAMLAVVGILLGLAGSAVLTRVMQSQLYGVSSVDPLTFGAVTGVLLVVALAAVGVAAARAARIDPVTSLRDA